MLQGLVEDHSSPHAQNPNTKPSDQGNTFLSNLGVENNYAYTVKQRLNSRYTVLRLFRGRHVWDFVKENPTKGGNYWRYSGGEDVDVFTEVNRRSPPLFMGAISTLLPLLCSWKNYGNFKPCSLTVYPNSRCRQVATHALTEKLDGSSLVYYDALKNAVVVFLISSQVIGRSLRSRRRKA